MNCNTGNQVENKQINNKKSFNLVDPKLIHKTTTYTVKFFLW